MTASRLVRLADLWQRKSRALQHIDRGQPQVAADMVWSSIRDLLTDAAYVKTKSGHRALLCESSGLAKVAHVFSNAGVELVEGREE